MKEVYLDNSATTKPFEELLQEFYNVNSNSYANPSSLHKKGLEAENIIKNSRQILADSLGVDSGEIFFTSGGTESNNIALLGQLNTIVKRNGAVAFSTVEHPSINEVLKEFEKRGVMLFPIPVDSNGVIKVNELEEILKNNKIMLVSIMHVNNEVGSIQPIREVLNLKKRYGFSIHIDAVQSHCKIDLSKLSREIDTLSVSAHKIHGLKGCGAIYIKKGVKIEPIIFGGSQEKSLRSGTENVPGIWAYGRAVELIKSGRYGNYESTRIIKDKLKERLFEEVPNISLNGSLEEKLSAPHILNVTVKGIPAEVLLHSLEEKGIYVSTGSACSSRKKKVSHVLTAMGVSGRDAESSIRISLSLLNSEEEVEYVVESFKECVKVLMGN